MATILALLVAMAKAIPALDSLLLQADAALREHRRSAANTQTDADRARIFATPWSCPRTCPHRVQHDGPQQPPAPPLTP